MFKIKNRFLKLIYRLLIFKIIIIDKKEFRYYDKLKTFCEYRLPSNMGDIIFTFKEDRRFTRYNSNRLFYFNSFIVELNVPDNIEVKEKVINDKIVIVVKCTLFKVNYRILSEVLLDIYVNKILRYIKKQSK